MTSLHHQHQSSAIRNGLLAALPPEAVERLRPRLRPVELLFDRTLYPAGGAVETVLFVESGMGRSSPRWATASRWRSG